MNFFVNEENKVEKPKRVKKIKKEKDKNAPKKSLTAFLYFVQKKQLDFKAANPSLIHKEVIAKMGAAWHTMTDKDKKPFNELAATDKARYEKQKQEYQNTLKKSAAPKKAPAGGKSTTEKKSKVISFKNFSFKIFLI